MTNDTQKNPIEPLASSALLADALRELLKLLEDGDLVRNIDGDSDPMVFFRQGIRIATILKKAQDALNI